MPSPDKATRRPSPRDPTSDNGPDDIHLDPGGVLTDEAACTPLHKLVGNMHNHVPTDPMEPTCHLSAESTSVGAVLTTDIQAITALDIKPGVATHLAVTITRALKDTKLNAPRTLKRREC